MTRSYEDDYRLMCEKLARALRVYAKPENWGRDDWNVLSIHQTEYGDPGKRARATLKRYEKFLSAVSQNHAKGDEA